MDYKKQLKAVDTKISMELLHTQIKELAEKLDEHRKVLDANCQHEHTTVKRDYKEGGYDYVSSVTITETCNLCHKILLVKDDKGHRGYFA